MNVIARDAYAAWRLADQMLLELADAGDDYWQVRAVYDEMSALCVEFADVMAMGGGRVHAARGSIDRACDLLERVRSNGGRSEVDIRQTTLLLTNSARTAAARLVDEQPIGSADHDLLRSALVTLDQLDSILTDPSAAAEVIHQCRVVVNDVLVAISRLSSPDRAFPNHIALGGDDAAEGVMRILWD